MGLIQTIQSFFNSSEKKAATGTKHVTINTYASIESLFDKKELRTLGVLHISGPARAGKGDELFDFVKEICQRHNALHELNISGVEGLEEIKEEALKECASLTKVVLPTGVLSIKNEAFMSCVNLQSISLPAGLERINESAFANCPKLEAVTLPDSLFRLGKDVFAGDDSITAINITHRIESIGVGALNCKNLKEITVEAHNPSYIAIDNVLYSRNGSALVKYANNKTEKEFTIPENVVKISESAFAECDNLQKVNIPNNLTIIARRAFHRCKNITEIALPSAVEKIDEEAFSRCTALTTFTASPGLTIIGPRAFMACSSLTKVSLPSSVIKIGDEAFLNCTKLGNFEIPQSVEYTGNNILKGTLSNS